MRSRLTSMFSFIIVLAVVEASMRLAAPQLPVDADKWPRIEIAQKLQQMAELIDDGKEFDVVFVGSSMMADGIDPVAFTEASGLYDYNAAFAGPAMRVVTPWTLDIVQPLLDPEVVVVGVQSRELADNGPKNNILYDKFVTSPGYRQATSGIADRLEGALEGFSYFLRYRRVLRHPSEIVRSAEHQDTIEGRKVLGPQGSRADEPVTYHFLEKFKTNIFEAALKDFAVGGPEYEALVRLYNELAARGVRLIVMSMPVTPDYYSVHAHPSQDMAAYHDVIRRFADETGATVIDAERAFASTDAFREPMHLDVDGRAALATGLGRAWEEILATRGAVIGMSCAGPAGPCHLSRPAVLGE